jgi:hypothetical protein
MCAAALYRLVDRLADRRGLEHRVRIDHADHVKRRGGAALDCFT